jgi:hypothetical protein
VAAISQSENGDAVLLTLADTDVDSNLAEPLPETALAIGYGHGVCIDEEL